MINTRKYLIENNTEVEEFLKEATKLLYSESEYIIRYLERGFVFIKPQSKNSKELLTVEVDEDINKRLEDIINKNRE